MAKVFVFCAIASMLVLGVASHRTLSGVPAQRSLLTNQQIFEEAVEQQRILAELEEVHQLRERMLQEGKFLLVLTSCLLGTCPHRLCTALGSTTKGCLMPRLMFRLCTDAYCS